MCETKSSTKKAVFILEDDKFVLDSWITAIRNSLKGVHVAGCQRQEDASRVLKKLKGDGFELFVFIVDQVEGTGQGGNKQWGTSFLKKIKKEFPDSFRIMFTSQAEHKDIQKMLDEKLIHDFATKATKKEVMVGKIKNMLKGINSGNIQAPSAASAEEDFENFLQKWINSMPKQGETIIDGLDGTHYKAGELLTNSELRRSFRKVFDAMKLDRLVDRSK